MKATYAAPLAGLTLLAAVGIASAQTSGSPLVTVSNQATSTAPAAGATGATVGSFTLTSTQSGQAGNVNVASIPLTLTTGSGAIASNLSSCQIYGPNNTAINTSGNVLSTPVSGTNTVIFDSPLQLSGGATTSFTVRCNVANGTPSGGTFQFSAGTPVFTPALGVSFNATSAVRPGAQDTLLGLVQLSAVRSGSGIQVPSLPLTVSFGGGAQAGDVSDCRVRPTSNLAAPLNNVTANVVGITQGANTIPFDSPFTVPAGGISTLAITCDVAASAPSGGTILISIAPADIDATVSGTGASVTPSTAFTANGNAAPVAGSVLISSSAGTPTTPTTPTIPGVPNTGENGSANLMILAVSAIGILLGFTLLRRKGIR